jgi:hypothetical protein
MLGKPSSVEVKSRTLLEFTTTGWLIIFIAELVRSAVVYCILHCTCRKPRNRDRLEISLKIGVQYLPSNSGLS